MRFENRFEVEGAPAQVIALFEDLPLVAGFLPGASVGERSDDGSYPATLTVAFGPKRVAFRGSLTPTVDKAGLCGSVVGHASTDLRGAKMSVTMDYRLAPAAAGTEVQLVSEAELTGMLAEFARTGGVAVTQALLAEFSQRFSAHVRSLQPAAPAPAQAAAPVAASAAPPALSAFSLLWQILKSAWRGLLGRPRG